MIDFDVQQLMIDIDTQQLMDFEYKGIVLIVLLLILAPIGFIKLIKGQTKGYYFVLMAMVILLFFARYY